MRCINIVLCVFLCLAGCEFVDKNTSDDELPPIPDQKAVDDYEYTLNGGTFDLAKRNGCMACHTADRVVVGPAWKAVSLRYKDYPAAQEYLVNKVKNGGKGAWGDLPMPAYSPRVPDETIQSLVERILKGEDGRVTLVDGEPTGGQVLAGEIDKFQFQGFPNLSYKIVVVSTVGDADLYVYDPLLPRQQSLLTSSELRDGDDSVEIDAPAKMQYYEVDVLGHLDSEYEITLTSEILLPGP